METVFVGDDVIMYPMQTLIAIDLETTGLNSDLDTIIEIAAVRFDGDKVLEEWTTLVNPGRPIPQAITQLTGITHEMAAPAPYLDDIYPDFLEFVGADPVVGHNIAFDLSFLYPKGGFKRNIAIDTYEIAAVLLPSAERYALGSLTKVLDIPAPESHRDHGAHGALVDARMTHSLFMRLFEKAVSLPLDLLAEIVHLSEKVEWSGRWAFQQAYYYATERHSTKRPQRGRVFDLSYAPIFSDKGRAQAYQPLQDNNQPKGLNVEDVAALLEHGGAFSHHFPHFEHRPEQVEMLSAVTRAISEGKHLLVEAGTGTGKSMAYLIPAALYAIQNQRRVVISTNTINLQEQLIKKDIPDLQAALGIDLRAVVLKGRANYICPRRLKNFLHRDLENADQVRVLSKALVWLLETKSGDRSEITLHGGNEMQVWNMISAEDDGCTSENCVKHSGGICPFYRVRIASQTAHLLIVNHALLLSDVATGNRVLPDYDYLIVDEGHHLEAATTNALSFQITQTDLERMLRELGSASFGLLGKLMSNANHLLPPDQIGSLNYLVEQATTQAFRFQQLNHQFFVMLGQFLWEQRQGKQMGQYSQQERILPATRTQPAWMDVEVKWDDAEHALKALLATGSQLVRSTGEMAEHFLEEIGDTFTSISDLFRRLGEAYTQLHNLMFEPTADRIYWVEMQPSGKRLMLQSAPLHVGSLMEKHLWYDKTSVIVTSATLTTAGEFDYIRERLNAQDAEELVLGSPYDYENSVLLYLVNNIPEPNEQGYQRAVERGLINLCHATGGRTLVLFTAVNQLRATAQAIKPILENRSGVLVLEQGEGASRHALLETFRNTPQAVLLGTRSFWEGVDVPGDALSVLVIAKLPFAVPSDPIVAARSETFENPFSQYSLPEAILLFRQGFGRLIRSQSDRGVVAVFDKRLLTKQYGRQFLDSLPACTKRAGTMDELPGVTVKWLNI